jgi:hypothetical protein
MSHTAICAYQRKLGIAEALARELVNVALER